MKREILSSRRSPRRVALRRFAAFLVTFATTALAAAAHAAPPPLEPASSGGLAAVDRALARLSAHQRLLIIAAHPDDEDTRLLTYVARGLGGEAAYLALSRGEGGQNLIGPELGVGLGLLRSRELLAARSVDGARQYFTRAYDFGYTRSLDETLELWPKDVLLEDAIRVIRRFKPQVLAAVFPPTSRAGHGQHWASGVVADEAFDLAGDPSAHPELADAGLYPWRPETFFRASFFDPAAATLKLDLGTLDPMSGRSLFQISLQSRSQHRCQDMGVILAPGEASDALIWQRGGAGPEAAELFEGVDTRLRAMASPLPAGALKRGVEDRLARVEELARRTREGLSPVTWTDAAVPLLEIVGLLREVAADLAADPTPAARQVRDLVEEKLEVAEEGLASAAGILADAYSERETVVPGGRLEVRSAFWNAGPRTVDGLRVEAVSGVGWRTVEVAPAPEERSFFSARLTNELLFTVEAPADAEATVPYFLRRPLNRALYDWSAASAEVWGEPFEPPPLVLRFSFTLDGVPVVLEREVVSRVRDQARGEVRRPLRAVPRLEVAVEPELLVWPIGGKAEERLRVEVRSNVEEAVSARLEVTVPDGWPEAEALEVGIDEPFGRRVVDVVLRVPGGLAGGRYELPVAAVLSDGERYGMSYPLVDYEHIRPTPMPGPARVEVSAGDIRLPSLGRVGYIRGASDRVPEFLLQVGVPLEVLHASDLAAGDLGVYDAIVVGSRAYETDSGLERANPRLLDYARRGGLVIVQYQQYQYSNGGFAPYPFEISRPHDRVTDERAGVRVLDPSHPVFRAPNAIANTDWDGWVQERGLYFGGTWGDEWTPLLAMSDPGGDEKRGALLVSRVGEGHYVYTGLAFFRQLPAGVVGAYRLFANLLALSEIED